MILPIYPYTSQNTPARITISAHSPRPITSSSYYQLHYIIMIYQVLLITFIAITTTNRVIEVTAANIQAVVRSGTLPLLLTHPQCPHASAYAQKFIRIRTQQNLGIVDCLKDKSVCQFFNVTRYPTLIQISSEAITPLDKDRFLLQHNAIDQNDPSLLATKLLTLLKDQKGWAAVILEEQSLPIIDRLSNHENNRVFYVKNPSRLHESLYALVGRQLGCWILRMKEGVLVKYYCGSGYNNQDLQRQLLSFEGGKIEPYFFVREEDNSSYLQYGQLQQMVLDVGRRGTQCKLIYFYAKQCQQCSLDHIQLIREVLQKTHQQTKYQLQLYDMDHQMLPKGLTLRRLPELASFCQGRLNLHGNLFNTAQLKHFLNTLSTHAPLPIEPKTEQTEGPSQEL